MNIHVTKSSGEEALVRRFEEVSGELPNAGGLSKARRDAIAQFVAVGLPTRRVEAWKYTDLRAHLKEAFAFAQIDDDPGVGLTDGDVTAGLGPLGAIDCIRLVFIDGRYAAGLSSADLAGNGVKIMALPAALDADPDCVGELLTWSNAPANEPVVTLNTAFMQDGAIIHVAQSPAKPLHIIHLARGDKQCAVAMRNHVSVADGVSVTLVESHGSLGEAAQQTNTVTQLGIGEGANVEHIKVQNENHASTHLASWMVELAAGAGYRAAQLTIGGALTRNQVFLKFSGADASAHLNGAFLLRGSQHCDTTLYVDHSAPGCTSREEFKGVLDEESRGVFQGKIMVRAEAQKTDGKQMSQALMLSDTCEFDAKPELEIFADDVVCGHGATSGRIDEDQLFYLRARGISEEVARALLIKAFVGEVLEIVSHEGLRTALGELTDQWL